MVGKNYRLQNIQLSKITPGEISPRGNPSVIAGRFPPDPLVVREPRPFGPRRAAARQSRRFNIGEYRARTGDLLVANQALSQLS